MDSNITSNVSLYEDELKFYLVQIGDRTTEMEFAHRKLIECVGERYIIDASGRKCEQYLQNATKKDIFILDEFAGEIFDKLCRTNALILGPRCVISCFMDNLSVPNNQSPVFTLAMRNLLVCLSSLSLDEKRNLKKLIGFMGGYCIDQLTGNASHLVTAKVVSKKYEQAAIQQKEIMKPSWVTDVWKKNQIETVLATDKMFEKHRVPIFYNLVITTTGIKEKVKVEVKRLIEANGGAYSGEFSSNRINMLILDKNPKESQKWKAAINSNKDCLTYNWIYDSVAKGYAIPFQPYKIVAVVKPVASTPEKRPTRSGGSNDMFNFNVTNASAMSNVSFANVINETNVSVMSVATQSGEVTSPLHRITLLDAKMAGLFLDGCNIFACGFASDEKEKIWKILNSGGATRYDSINSNVSHILVGKPTKADVVMLQAAKTDAVMLKLDWLIESIAKKAAITDLEPFMYRLNGKGGKSADTVDESSSVPSPASKRNILSMTGNSMKQPNRRRLEFLNDDEPNKLNASVADVPIIDLPINENMENLILDQYLHASVNKDKSLFKMPAPVESRGSPEKLPSNYVPMNPSINSLDFEDSSVTTNTETEYNFLENKTVFIHGFDEDSIDALVYDCQLGGGIVITDKNHTQEVDYLILAADIMSMNGIAVKAKNVVNHYWLLNAKRLNRATNIPYYYKPIIFSEDLKPLTGMVIVFSTYAGDERLFLMQLAEIMGAGVEESYRKVARPLLICPLPDNKKYEAAIKWNMPVVTCEWLLDCYKCSKRLPLKNFLVGDSISPVDDIADTQNISPKLADSVIDMTRVTVANADEEIPPNIRNSGKTPVNPRISSLRTPAADKAEKKNSPKANAAITSAGAAGAAAGDGIDYDEFFSYYTSFDTPEREYLRQLVITTPSTETPETKRRRFETCERATPEFARTPVLQEQRRQWLEERLNRNKPTDSEKNKKKSTPWTEYKRRFWKEALGDGYESPSQCYTQGTQAQVDATMPSSSRQLIYDTSPAQKDLEADINIRKFNEFIKNRDNAADVQEAIPGTAPRIHELDLPNTELPEIVGWDDRDECRSDMRFNGTPFFGISSSIAEIRPKIFDQIRQLNGQLCENQDTYDKMCTHLLCERPNRGEKTCCCIAGGKWVLSTDYIQHSIDAGRFLDEELYEWGNPKAAKNLPTLDEQEESVGKAIYRFRLRVQNTGKGAFKDLRAIVRTNKTENMKNLIEAGQGKVLNFDQSKRLSEQTDLLANATHLIIQPKFANLSADDIKAIKKSKVICVNMAYLSACIIEDCEQFPDPKPYLVKF